MKPVKKIVDDDVFIEVGNRAVRLLNLYRIKDHVSDLVAKRLWGKILDPVWAQLRRPK